MSIVLSGGNFGGARVEITDETNSVIIITDHQGAKWVYDKSVHPKTPNADFIGMAEDLPTPPDTPNSYVLPNWPDASVMAQPAAAKKP